MNSCAANQRNPDRCNKKHPEKQGRSNRVYLHMHREYTGLFDDGIPNSDLWKAEALRKTEPMLLQLTDLLMVELVLKMMKMGMMNFV